MLMDKKKILVAMSGGLDSSAVCLMLREQGYEVEGMTMRVWDLPRHFTDGSDVPDFIRSAQDLARRLGIRHHLVDVREEFRTGVVAYFLRSYQQGLTPNPCVVCNRDFKFRLLSEKAQELGFDLMATGHYVKTETENGHTYLLMGDDPKKDQSYFLWRVPQKTIERCVFPLGGMTKDTVRQYLAERGHESHARQKESMEICFVEGDYRDFLREQCPGLAEKTAGGSFVSTGGKYLGTHQGVPFYTVGQRKGLDIALGHPAYVLRLNAEKNTVVLGDEKDLLAPAFIATDEVWAGPDIPERTAGLSVRIRYHSQPVPCTIERLNDQRLLVRTEEPVSAITPGQSAVFYQGTRLMGGAFIDRQKGIGAYL